MLKFQLSSLDTIAVKYNQEPQICLTRVLELWLKIVNPPPSWSMLIEALQLLGEERLALELKEAHSLL